MIISVVVIFNGTKEPDKKKQLNITKSLSFASPF